MCCVDHSRGSLGSCRKVGVYRVCTCVIEWEVGAGDRDWAPWLQVWVSIRREFAQGSLGPGGLAGAGRKRAPRQCYLECGVREKLEEQEGSVCLKNSDKLQERIVKVMSIRQITM